MKPGYAIVRVDRYDNSKEKLVVAGAMITVTAPHDTPVYITVKKVVLNYKFAQQEVDRLNKLAADKSCIYFCQYTRIEDDETAGPYLGRLNNPEVFGEFPDLHAPMTPEQWDRMTNPEKYGYERDD